MIDLEKEIEISYRKVLVEATKGKGDEAAMDEIDRLAQVVRSLKKSRGETKRETEKK